MSESPDYHSLLPISGPQAVPRRRSRLVPITPKLPQPPPLPAAIGGYVILEVPLADVRGRTMKLDISTVATPGRIRLIEADAFMELQLLKIWEFPEFPGSLTYSAISYVWKGNPLRENDPLDEDGYFEVAGAEDGDPISVAVLRCTCLAALRDDMRHEQAWRDSGYYVWLDRLCIMQTDKQDKSWQITKMFQVYKQTRAALVLPGGVQRLVCIDEETSWIHRAWTLQEVLAPESSIVLFSWDKGPGRIQSENRGHIRSTAYVNVSVVSTADRCASISLSEVVKGCSSGQVSFCREGSDEQQLVDVNILGCRTANLVALQYAARWSAFGDHPCYYAIWRCALMRTSSRPVDMVFSIMGLFGAALDPKAYGVNDRLGATIALAQAILQNGGRADWLGLPSRIPLSTHLSTFPQFPETRVEGRAQFKTATGLVDAFALDDFLFPGHKGCFLPYARSGRRPAPGGGLEKPGPDMLGIAGQMDDQGYFTFTRKACTISCTASSLQQPVAGGSPEWPLARADDGKVWIFDDTLAISDLPFPRTAAVVLWPFFRWSRLLIPDGVYFKLMLVREHHAGRFSLVSYFVIPGDFDTWTQRTRGWGEYTFSVGGPGVDESTAVSKPSKAQRTCMYLEDMCMCG